MKPLESCVARLITSPIICCRMFSKKLQGPREPDKGSPANFWLAALKQAKASTDMSRGTTRGLLTAVRQGVIQQEGQEGDLLAGGQVLRFEVDEAVRLLVSLAHAPEPLFGYNSTRW